MDDRAKIPEESAAPRAKPGMAASSMVAAGILLSRVAGLVRESVTAAYFGTSMYASVIRAGLRMPNMLQNLLGEGTLSASFIPVYSELLQEGKKEEAGRVAGAIFALLCIVAGTLSLLGVVFAPLLTDIFLPGFSGEQRELTIRLSRVIFPMTAVLVLSAWALGILNSHRSFLLPYMAPVLWNVAIIGALVLLGGRLDEASLVMAFGWGALLGGVLQFLVQLPAVMRLERSLKIRWDTRLEPVRVAVSNAGPAVMGRGVVQLSGYIDVVLASLLIERALAIVGYAQTIYMLPISLFGMSVAAAELPELARQRMAAQDVLRERTNAALRRIAFFIVPSFVAVVLLGDVMVAALFQRGEFDPRDTRLVYLTLLAFSVGMLASTATRLFSSTFFALRDTRTPARIAVVRVAAAAVLGFGLMLQFEAIEIFGMQVGPGIFGGVRLGGVPLGVVGLALGSGIAAWIEWALIRARLRSRVGKVGAGFSSLARMFAAALLAAGAGWLVRWGLPAAVGPLLRAVAVFAAFGLVYFAVAAVLHLPEMDGVATRVKRITGRK